MLPRDGPRRFAMPGDVNDGKLVAHNCWRRIVRTGFIQQERGNPHFVGGDNNNPDLRASREIADAL
jgi:hypothetical protein